MTVTTTNSRNEYNGDGTTTVFSAAFFFLEDEDLVVLIRDANDVDATQVLTTDYTVSGAGNQAGGSVTMIVSPASGETLIIFRDPPITQETDYQSNEEFPASSHETALDKGVMISQRLDDRADRALVIPDADPVQDMVLPINSIRADHLLSFDPAGLPEQGPLTADVETAITVVVSAITPDPISIVASIATMKAISSTGLVGGEVIKVTDAARGGDFIVTVGTGVEEGGEIFEFDDDPAPTVLFLQRLNTGQIKNTTWYGAITDRSTDNTTEVQAALDAANGVRVHNPQGAFFDLSSLVFADGNFATDEGRYVLSYRADDDISNPQHAAGGVTNERVDFMQNNNTTGYVNEYQFSSGYSSGVILDVRRDVSAPAIGAGQEVEFGRTSVVWRQDGLTRVQFKYTDAAGDTSSPGLDDGWTVQCTESRVLLSGINQASFAATLAVNDMVKGNTSGARGWVKAIGGSDITVSLISGNTSTNTSGFQTGETVILEPAVETTTDTISTVGAIINTSRSNRLGFSPKNTYNCFTNVQSDKAFQPLTVGGIIGIQQSNTTNGSFTNAEVQMVDDSETITERVRLQMEAATGDFVVLLGTSNKEGIRVEDASGTATITTQTLRASSTLQSPTIFVSATPAAGGDPKILSGTATPETSVAAGVGSLFMRDDGGANTTLYVKESGTGNTGWIAK